MRNLEEREPRDPLAIKRLAQFMFGSGLITLAVTLLHGPPVLIGLFGLFTVVFMLFLIWAIVPFPM